jgi:hypothetical protein
MRHWRTKRIEAAGVFGVVLVFVFLCLYQLAKRAECRGGNTGVQCAFAWVKEQFIHTLLL